MSLNGRRIILVLVLAALGGAGGYWLITGGAKPQAVGQPNDSVAQNKPVPAIRYPVPDTESEQEAAAPAGQPRAALPAVDDSDPTIQAGLARIFGDAQFAALFVPKDLIRRIVVSIISLAGRRQASPEFLPLKAPEGALRVAGSGSDQVMVPENYARYAPFVAAAQAMDAKKIVRLYMHFYSLFQTAYSDLGTKGYFNDQLVDVVDDLLNTPENQDPIKLSLPGVFYKYTDPKLEELSAGQKILLRMGPDNLKTMKSKLREIRELLAKK